MRPRRSRSGGCPTSRVAPSRPAGPDKRFYPIFVDLEGRRCLVVGGGAAAADRVERLLEHGAVVRLVAPTLSPALAALVAAGRVAEHLPRAYRRGDLDGCLLAVVAVADAAAEAAVWADAEARDLLVNTVDVPARCGFIVPSVARRGELAVAVSTGGASPAVAIHLRRRVERLLERGWGPLVALLRELRPALVERHPDLGPRRDAVERLLATDVVERLAAGDDGAVAGLVRETLGLDPPAAAGARGAPAAPLASAAREPDAAVRARPADRRPLRAAARGVHGRA
ncbi:MAG: precorrin-2 dehydrogenase [Miltoncostaeaceae bacterium]|nr:precorrin-2 dehydrogenase [Miltoncostaeaceae bacterium]